MGNFICIALVPHDHKIAQYSRCRYWKTRIYVEPVPRTKHRSLPWYFYRGTFPKISPAFRQYSAHLLLHSTGPLVRNAIFVRKPTSGWYPIRNADSEMELKLCPPTYSYIQSKKWYCHEFRAAKILSLTSIFSFLWTGRYCTVCIVMMQLSSSCHVHKAAASSMSHGTLLVPAVFIVYDGLCGGVCFIRLIMDKALQRIRMSDLKSK